jgi:anti-sigma regulatory factor (Ser/Thr protein kinase)
MNRRKANDFILLTCAVRSNRKAIGRLRQVALDTVKTMGVEVNHQQLELVLNEALTNALIYGNLKVPGDLRESKGDDLFWKMVEQREQDGSFNTREIALRMECHEDRLVLIVTDEGDGFDWKGFVNSMDGASDDTAGPDTIASHGRGLLILRNYVDDLRWNEKGNEVSFAINFSPREETMGGFHG